ncbi:energy transducer TonB [Bdellovibrio sp. HCB2-146]|uniref:energy transducer TonB family protein n=1 Tax=Bdellovibrio sp. HCB2-146 TaxID=3394362 RepID=UPI0039BC7AF0
MPVIRAILFSFGFHILLLTAVVLLAPILAAPPKEAPIEIALVQPTAPVKKLKNKQDYTVNPMAPDHLKAPDDETLAKLLSKERQRVKQEMVAPQFGKNENRSNQTARPSDVQKKVGKNGQQQTAKSEDGYKAFNPGEELQDTSKFNEGVSTFSGRVANDVRTGMFTALNADRHLYYSFYSRLYDLVSYRYDKTTDQAYRSLDPSKFMDYVNRRFITEVEFLLDSDGVLQKAILMKASGLPVFDNAAILAFQQARVFPNPPQEMIEDDGYIHLRFSFEVRLAPPTLVNRN